MVEKRSETIALTAQKPILESLGSYLSRKFIYVLLLLVR